MKPTYYETCMHNTGRGGVHGGDTTLIRCVNKSDKRVMWTMNACANHLASYLGDNENRRSLGIIEIVSGTICDTMQEWW